MKRVTVAASARLQARLDARGDNVLAAITKATPAQIDAYLTANVTTLAQARRVLLALALAIRSLQDGDTGQ